MAIAALPAGTFLHFFAGVGYRPAIYALMRDQYGDKTIAIVAPDADTPYPSKYGKYDGPLDLIDTPVVDLVAVGTPGMFGLPVGAAPVNPGLPGPGWITPGGTGLPPFFGCCFSNPSEPDGPPIVVVPPPLAPVSAPEPLGLMIGIFCLFVMGSLFKHSHALETIR